MNKYAIYTSGETFPVLEKDGEYYIGAPGTGHFSGQWKFLGVVERLKNSRNIIKPEDALKITDWKFKNGSPKYQVVDLDHGTVRRWASPRQVISFGPISDNMFSVATKTDNDKEIVLEESKKYGIYMTSGEKGIYDTKLIDTVDSEDQAIDRVAELRAETGNGVSYKEILNDNDLERLRKIIEYTFWDEGTRVFRDYFSIKDIDNEWIPYVSQEDIAKKGSDEYFKYLKDETLRKIIKHIIRKTDFLRNLSDKDIYMLQHNMDDFIEDNNIDANEARIYEILSEEIQGINTIYENNKKEEECSQASGVASGVNGKIDSFPINPKEMEKQRLKEDIENPYFVVEDIGGLYIMAGPFKTKEEAEKKMSEQIKEYNLEEEADIIYAWDWNTIHKYYIDRYKEDIYSSYSEFINGAACASYYKEEKLEESSDDKNTISNFINQCINSGKFNKEQINEIKRGFEDGLTLEQIKLYADPKFNWRQMHEIRWGFVLDLSIEEVKLFADPKFNDDQMEEILNGLRYNLSIEQVKTYADPKYSSSQMEKIWRKIKKENSLSKGIISNENEDDLFELRGNLMGYLNENTDYEWDPNEMYDNCVITESDDDYIEVFCWLNEDKIHYTINSEGKDIGNKYYTLEDVVKNLPELKEYEESKDIVNTLQEMALLEDYKEESRVSPQKQKFIDYCKDKIEDLGDIEIYDEDYEEDISYHKLMHTEGIREFNDLYIIANFDDYENENLIAINNENKIVINTPMIDCNGYAATMQFDKIDKQFYDQLMDFWDDIYMDEMIEEE